VVVGKAWPEQAGGNDILKMLVNPQFTIPVCSRQAKFEIIGVGFKTVLSWGQNESELGSS